MPTNKKGGEAMKKEKELINLTKDNNYLIQLKEVLKMFIDFLEDLQK